MRNDREAAKPDAGARLERLPMSRYQYLLFAVVATAFLFDTADTAALAYMLGTIKADLGLSVAEAAPKNLVHVLCDNRVQYGGTANLAIPRAGGVDFCAMASAAGYARSLEAPDADTFRQIAGALNDSPRIPVRVVHKPIVTTPEEIRALCLEANGAAACAGLILWMHTFSPAKMWIGGLSALHKPFAHLHTQYNDRLPWS